MHRFSAIPPQFACVLVFLVGIASLLIASPAYADSAMPSVVGKTEAEAVRQLESLGLEVRVITVAEAPPGRVYQQEPTTGARVAAGDEVYLRVGVRVRIMTLAPRVVGRLEDAVLESLGSAYDLKVDYVAGPQAYEGRIARQHPQPGENVPLRGTFKVEVVRNAVIVPILVGRTEGAAREELEQAGLSAHVRYVKNSGAKRGTVISQDPRSGAETLPGGVVEIRVAGFFVDHNKRQRVRVPDVTGLHLRAAEEELLARGLVPHLHLIANSGKRDWTVLSQETQPGRRAAIGASIGMNIAKPQNVADGVVMPSLYGMSRGEATELMEHMGLRLQILDSYSVLPANSVFRQAISPGTRLRPGQTVPIEIAVPPPAGWTVPIVKVPNVRGLPPAQAYVELMQAGLQPKLGRENAPDWRVGHVFTQTPKAGQRVRVGSAITYRVPFRARVPDLRGRTRMQALERLQAAGLQGLGRMRGPQMDGLTEVIWQEVPHGRVVARGSLVKFNYRIAPPNSGMRPVPDVVGVSKEAAEAKLVAAGFKAILRPAAFGNGPTRVITQSPRAGQLRPQGHEILVTYHHDQNTLPDMIRVPRVIGMKSDVALRKMESLGFNPRLIRQGPSTGGVTEIIAQNPIAGSQRPRGSNITLTYKERPADGTFVVVPNVVGKRLDKAMSEIKSAGLRTSFSRVGTHVRSQEPAAGTRAKAGSAVKVKLGF